MEQNRQREEEKLKLCYRPRARVTPLDYMQLMKEQACYLKGLTRARSTFVFLLRPLLLYVCFYKGFVEMGGISCLCDESG